MAFSLSTQYTIGLIEIDGVDAIGFFEQIQIHEHLYSPVITGSIVMLDTTAGAFIEKNEIEGNEDIEFEFSSAKKETLKFKGKLNGLRNKVADTNRIMYTFDFTSEQVRKNETSFCPNAYKNKSPESIAQEIVEGKLESKIEKWVGKGRPMTFIGGNKRPVDIIRYIIKHGISQEGRASATPDKEKTGEVKGTTGFLCWQTLDGYRFASVDDVLNAKAGDDKGKFTYRIQNNNLSLEEATESIIMYDFKVMGDFQSKLRSGAFAHKQENFNFDTGEFSEKFYDGSDLMSPKQREQINKTYTRIITNFTSNERFQLSCDKAQDYQWDQNNLAISQNIARQNTFDDQHGNFTLSAQFTMKAGDSFEAKIPKFKNEGDSGYEKITSGRYIIKAITHHINSNGAAYTKISTVRSTKQQDDKRSRKS